MSDTPSSGPPSLARTALPEFNQLLTAVDALRDGMGTSSVAQDALGQVDRVLGGLQEGFLASLPMREHTPLLQEVAAALDDHFIALQSLVPEVAAFLDAANGTLASDALARMHAAVNGVCSALRRLEDEDAQRERVCEIPAIDEMVRVGRAFLRGRVPHEGLRLAVVRFEAYHQVLTDGISALQPSPREAEVLAAQADIAAALTRQGAALQTLVDFFQSGDEKRLAAALTELVTAGDALVHVQRSLVDAHTREPQVPCLRCGAMNGSGERVCSRCHARLPWVAALESEASQLDLLESGAAPDAAVQYAHLTALEEMTRGVQRGDQTPSALEALLEAQETRLREVEARLARLQQPSPNTPPDQMETFNAARRSLAAGLERMREGVGQMRQALEIGALERLDDGLRTCLHTADDLMALQQIGSEALASGQV